jgi:hypothetical protein
VPLAAAPRPTAAGVHHRSHAQQARASGRPAGAATAAPTHLGCSWVEHAPQGDVDLGAAVDRVQGVLPQPGGQEREASTAGQARRTRGAGALAAGAGRGPPPPPPAAASQVQVQRCAAASLRCTLRKRHRVLHAAARCGGAALLACG